jgi:F-type H+-transporting ATPase subunit epsilon
MAFKCVVVTPEQQVLDEMVSQAIVPAPDGLIGILTDRAPLVMKLGIGPLRIDTQAGAKQYYLVDGGVAQMKDNSLTILTQTATPAGELDGEAARAEYAKALELKIGDEKSFEERQAALQRARAKEALAK